MVKFTLSLDDDFSFRLIAICSHAKDYRLSWYLNQRLGLKLQKGNDLELKRKNELYGFSFYGYEIIEDQLEYFLIGNKCRNAQLVPERKQIDFFLQLRGPVQDIEVDGMITKIKEIPIVLTAHEEDVYEMKSRKNLIF